jgi:hypothetical protein
VRTLVIQSQRADLDNGWTVPCLTSVEGWAASCGFDYRFYGDEALQCTPQWYRDKLGGRTPIVADLARLLLIGQALERDYDQACWIDADVLLFAPDQLRLNNSGSCAFGREYWVEADPGATVPARLKVHRNVHNAICTFKAGCPVLPFLIHATQQIIRRADAAHIAPQMVGPKLLGALHNIVGFDLIESVGAFSPTVVAELASGQPGQAVEMLIAQPPAPLAGANLCASVNGDRELSDACVRLLEAGQLPRQ